GDRLPQRCRSRVLACDPLLGVPMRDGQCGLAVLSEQKLGGDPQTPVVLHRDSTAEAGMEIHRKPHGAQRRTRSTGGAERVRAARTFGDAPRMTGFAVGPTVRASG